MRVILKSFTLTSETMDERSNHKTHKMPTHKTPAY